MGTFDDIEEAERRADAAAVVLSEGGLASVGGVTLAGWGEKWLERRELSGEVRDIENQGRNFKKHIATASFALRPIASITRGDVREWLVTMAKKRKPGTTETISRSTVKRVYALLRVMLRDACEEEIIRENVARDVKVRGRDESTHEPWTFLSREEQDAIRTCTDIPEHARLVMTFAWLTGLRSSEIAALRLADVLVDDDDPHVVVRFSRKDKATKSGKIRRVPLLPDAVEVVRRWLAMLPTFALKNPVKLAFPTMQGARRQAGKMLGQDFDAKTKKKTDRFSRYLQAAGITRHVRFHDLRHTCGSSLVSGVWGRRWSIEEVREVLGHQSIAMTTRYSHLGDTALKIAARETSIAPPIAPPIAVWNRASEAPTKPQGNPALAAKSLILLGGSKGARTPDLRIKSPQLYRLSYRPDSKTPGT